MSVVLAAVVAMLGGLLFTLPATAAAAAPPAPQPGADRLQVYTGDVSRDNVAAIRGLGLGEGDLLVSPNDDSKTVSVDVLLSGAQAAELAKQGIELEVKASAAEAQRLQGDIAAQANGYTVYRQYGEPDGIRDELIDIAAAHPDIAKLVILGQTHWGQDILAVKLTRNARRVEDGRRPATLYTAAQHARNA